MIEELNRTEQMILRELSRGSKSSKQLESTESVDIKYQAILKVCATLEKKGYVKRGAGTRNYPWILTSKGADYVVGLTGTMSSNGKKSTNLPVVRNYDHDQMIPTNIKEFVDPKGVMNKIKSILFNTNGIMMEGDSGIGKTMCVMKLAQDEGLPFYHIQGTPDTRVEDLIGFPMQVGDNTIWIDGIIPRVLQCSQQRKCVLFIDEVNRLESNVQSVFFPLLDDRCSCVIHERGGEIIKGNKKNLAVVATANKGAGFYGINPLDLAFQDRFDIVKMEYLDEESEVKLLHDQTGIYMDLCRNMVEVANDIRERTMDPEKPLDKPLSTRCLLRWGEIATRFHKDKVSEDPLYEAAELVVINRFNEQDEVMVRNIVDKYRGVSMDEEKEKKKQEEFRSPEDEIQLDDIMKDLGPD